MAENAGYSGLPQHPSQLPLPWRALVTVFVLVIGLGYLAALVNLIAQNELVDGKPGLSKADLLLKYHGGYIDVDPGDPPPPRMLEMIDGKMRKNFETEADYQIVRRWILEGAVEAAFRTPSDIASERSAASPEGIIIRDCLICHAADSGETIAETSSYGPNDSTVDFTQLARFAKSPAPEAKRIYRSPKDWRTLALSTHAHLLSVPIFVVIIGALFLWTGWPSGPWSGRFRVALACAPLVLFAGDVSCWWLARLETGGELFALIIGATGALFGFTYVLQGVVVLVSLWRRP
ncbi:MAG: hypothetical protein ACE5E5_08580 [Phycisphaerae bacterium]